MSEQKDRMLAGELYRANDPELRADSERCDRLLRRYNATGAEDRDERTAILRELLGSVGDARGHSPAAGDGLRLPDLDRAGHVHQQRAVILDVGRVTIGADVQIGPNVQLLTPTHPLDPELRRSGAEAAEPITIGDNVWLGGGVIVCPGVTIGQDTVVGAGAVVTRDLPPGVLAVGNPARVIRSLV